MGIQLEEAHASGSPVVKRGAVGEQFYGAIVNYEWRQIVKDGEPQFKDDGKPRNEMVVHLLAVEGGMVASIGDDSGVPNPGDSVRAIMRGGAAGQWIDAVGEFKKSNGRGVEVGDILKMTTTHATRYDSTSSSYTALGELTTQQAVDDWKTSPANLDRKESIGWRGDVAIGVATGDRAQWVARAEEAYHNANRQSIPAGPDTSVADHFGGSAVSNEDPFRIDAGEWMPGHWGSYPTRIS